jgi:hypothetical protein
MGYPRKEAQVLENCCSPRIETGVPQQTLQKNTDFSSSDFFMRSESSDNDVEASHEPICTSLDMIGAVANRQYMTMTLKRQYACPESRRENNGISDDFHKQSERDNENG